jgi:hypothetical protein
MIVKQEASWFQL